MKAARPSPYAGGLFRRQFFALLGCSLLFFLAIGVVVAQGAGKRLIARELAACTVRRDELRSRILSFLADGRADVGYLAKLLDAGGEASLTPGGAARSLALFAEGEVHFSEVLLADPGGKVVADGTGAASLANIADRAYFQAASLGHPPVLGLIRAKTTGDAVIALAAAVRPADRGSWVAVGFIPLAAVSAIVGEASRVGLGKAYLVEGSGRVLSGADYPRLFRELGADAASGPEDGYAIRELRAGRSSAAVYEGHEGAWVVGAYSWIETLGLGLVVEVSRDRILEPLSSLVGPGLVVLALAIGILALFSYAFSAALVAPIRALAGAAEAVIGDRGFEPIELRTNTELDELIDFFNKMIATVRAREDGLRDDAARDSLTGLYNHARIEAILEIEIKRKRRSGEKLSFVMLDIDYFKRVNDEYGHLAGDEVLRGIARLLEESVRAGDVAGRYGGEEFAVILDAGSDEEVQVFCERMRSVVEGTRFDFEGKEIRVTVSLGWSRMGVEGLGSYDAVRNADRALYFAKETGRNRVAGGDGPKTMGSLSAKLKP